MDAKVNYTVVGLIGILLIAALASFLIWINQSVKTNRYNTYVSYFTYDISGLNKNSLVKINGITVGQVKATELDKKNVTKVKITFNVKKTIPVTTASYTVIKSQGLTGAEYLALNTKNPSAPLLKKKEGERYPVVPSQTSVISSVESELKDTGDEVKVLVARVNDLLKSQNRVAVDKTLANIEKVTQTIANNSEKINSSINSLQGILTNTNEASKEFPALSKQTIHTLESVQQLADQFTLTGNKATLTLSKTTTAMQNITNQLLPTAQQLLQQLDQMISTLNQFGQELSNNPSMLIRGKYPAPPGPGEKK